MNSSSFLQLPWYPCYGRGVAVWRASRGFADAVVTDVGER
jgi:hypothetical protein